MIQKTYNSELKEYIQLPPWSETAQLYPARVEKSHRNSLMNYLASKIFIRQYTLSHCIYTPFLNMIEIS